MHVSKEELESKAKSHFRGRFRPAFNKTKAAKVLMLATTALVLAGIALVLGPLLLGGLAAGVATGVMHTGLAVSFAAFIPMAVDNRLYRTFEKNQIADGIANGTLVERYKNEFISSKAQALEQQSDRLSTKAQELKTQALSLREQFGLADAPQPQPATPQAPVTATAKPSAHL